MSYGQNLFLLYILSELVNIIHKSHTCKAGVHMDDLKGLRIFFSNMYWMLMLIILIICDFISFIVSR